MKKALRTLSIMMVLALLVGVIGVLPVSADGGYTANLGFADTAWGAQEWGENANTTVTGDGTYTISWDIPEGGTAAIDAGVFVIDIVGAQAALSAENKTYNVTAVTVTADGVEIPVDLSKVVTGDVEANGNFRIEIYNQYGSTAETLPLDPKAVVFSSNLTVTFTIETVELPSYTANLGFADTAWGAQEWGENANTVVAGDGTYTISWNIPEGGVAAIDAGVFVIDLVGAQAAMNEDNKTFDLTALTVTADGVEIPVDLEKVVTGDIEENGNFRIEIYNQYGSTAETLPLDPKAVVFASNLTVSFTLETIDKPAEATVGPWDAFLMFTDVDWAFGNWDANLASTSVTGAGSYSVTLNATDVGGDGATGCNGINVFCVDILGANASLLEQNQTFAVTDIKVIADGNEVALDASKIGAGDIEENGNFRIELYNIYGVTAEDPAMDGTNFTFAQTLTVEFTLAVVDATTGEVVGGEEVPAVPEFDPAGSYNAYLGLQTPNWTYRDAWNSANGIGSDYWGDFIYGNETSEKYGKVTDAVVAGNGTYTVSVTDFGTIIGDDFTAAGQDYFNLLYISTDIPLSESVVISDVKLIIDGKTVHTYKDAYLDPDEAEYVKILIQNIWNPDVAEISYYATPNTSVEMQFTISGFNYDNAASGEVEPEATVPQATEPAGEEKPEGGNGGVIAIIAVVAVAAVAAVVVVVSKKKKKA